MKNGPNKKNNSKKNTEFAELLDVAELEYEREFILGEYMYDFKIGNILVEINPTITHNSYKGLYNNPKSAYYHQNKTINALENGYACINVWDWDNRVEIIKMIKHKTVSYLGGEIPFDRLIQVYINNLKTKGN